MDRQCLLFLRGVLLCRVQCVPACTMVPWYQNTRPCVARFFWASNLPPGYIPNAYQAIFYFRRKSGNKNGGNSNSMMCRTPRKRPGRLPNLKEEDNRHPITTTTISGTYIRKRYSQILPSFNFALFRLLLAIYARMTASTSEAAGRAYSNLSKIPSSTSCCNSVKSKLVP